MREALYIAPDVAAVRRTLAPLIDRPDWHATPIERQLEEQADALLATHAVGDLGFRPVLSSWHPEHVGTSAAQLLAAPLTREDFLLAVAREHGFANPGDARGEHDPDFERAVDAVVYGELDVLRALLDASPELVRAQSAFGHRATLLHYLGANGVETWRQVTPGNAVDIARCLLERGAEVDAQAGIYGGSTTLALVASSDHPREAGLGRTLERTLIAAGAAGTAAPVDCESAAPILMCTSLAEALAMFRDELGFTVAFEWGDPADFAGVCLDRTQVFLCEGGQGRPGTWLMMFVDDVDALHASLSLQHAKVLEGPVDQPWGGRELVVGIHDEHVIRFGGPVG